MLSEFVTLKNRSKTAEVIFKDNPRHKVKSAGILDNFVTEELMGWANLIFVMEEWHRTELANKFPELYMREKIICLDIPDIYSFNDPELVVAMKDKTKEYFE